MKENQFILTFVILVVSTIFAGCNSKSGTGAGLGALIGGGIGQLAGKDTESTLAGAAIGAGAGYIIGSQQENKEIENNPDSFVKVPFTNSDGTITTIALRKVDSGYVGPKGEYYEQLPTQKELKIKYGH
jgi:outer membrane lipoprotein SlyB